MAVDDGCRSLVKTVYKEHSNLVKKQLLHRLSVISDMDPDNSRKLKVFHGERIIPLCNKTNIRMSESRKNSTHPTEQKRSEFR